MKGQAFTIAKLHYINGVVYFVAQRNAADVGTLANHSDVTTKSGDAKHPVERVRTLARFAEGLGLLTRTAKNAYTITPLGSRYHELRGQDIWALSPAQQKLLHDHILAHPRATPTVHAITSLLQLTREHYPASELPKKYAETIGKESAWKSDVTYEGFTKFGLAYLEELGLLNDTIQLPSSWTNPESDSRHAFLFTWNQSKWDWTNQQEAVYEVGVEGHHLEQWSCQSFKAIKDGDRAYLMRLGIEPKGLIGSGTIVGEPFASLHWDKEKAANGMQVHRVMIRFDVLSMTPLLGEDDLQSPELSGYNWHPQSSGITIPKEILATLEAAWSKVAGMPTDEYQGEPKAQGYTEGKQIARITTAYERNPEARRQCLLHHGTACKVCGMDFGKKYGELGDGFIHVHHIATVASKGGEYTVDPLRDLVPVCPNCHAMLHMQTPPLSVENLAHRIQKRGTYDP